MVPTQSGNPRIPVVDLSPYHDSEASPASRQAAADSLAAACKRYGFAYIINHGFSGSVLQAGFDMSKRMFALALEDKMKAPHPPGYVPHRGYSYPGLEQVYAKKKMEEEEEGNGDAAAPVGQAGAVVISASNEDSATPVAGVDDGDPHQARELKESYEIGSESNPPQTNIWLPDEVLPGFKDAMLGFYWELAEGSKTLLRAMAEGLRLEAAELEKLFGWHSAHNNQLRLLRYPPLSKKQIEGGKVARMSAHTDWSLFTILFQEDQAGLELEDPEHKGTWLDASPLEGALVLNVGEMWQRASNGLYKSANHFVNLPSLDDEPSSSGERHTRERFSIPYFVAPDNSAMIEVFDSLVDEDHPRKYEPVQFDKYSDWVAEHYYDGK